MKLPTRTLSSENRTVQLENTGNSTNGTISGLKQSVKVTAYLAALRKLPILTAEQRMTLERWNLRFPEMSMSPEEFLGAVRRT